MKIVIATVFLLVICTHTHSIPIDSSTSNCGYETCNLGKANKLNIHLVPHTHDDVGWLKTVDQYYYGSHTDICNHGVQYIIDSVIQALLENPDRRFIYVEMAFFWRWWNEQTNVTQNIVKQLVNEGRLEFISGGWSMHDEATTHYNSIIDQHSLGAEFLRENFGDCARPKIAWQIDPFGHSREVASLFAQMGFDGLFFGRIDYQDRIPRTAEKNLELLWEASANLGKQSWLFTGILPHGYSAPMSLCFDSMCGDPPIIDDETSPEYNVPERVEAFMRAVDVQSLGYATNHLIITMGDDFQYQNARENFKNLDKLIHYVNLKQEEGSHINVFYSTPSCYLYALNKADRAWKSKTDDFFPYASIPFVYWTGYFTSRPAFKRYERYSNNILQVVRQLNGYTRQNLREEYFSLSEAMGLAQHHDAVSGTEKQAVAEDYTQRLSDGIDQAEVVINKAYMSLMAKYESVPNLQQYLCHYTNISACLVIEDKEQFTVTFWNPTLHPVVIYPKIPVTRQYRIRDPDGNLITAEYLPISETVKRIPGRTSSADFEHTFEATLPALGYNTYYFEAIADKTSTQARTFTTIQNGACILENEYIRVEFDQNGDMKHIYNLEKNLTVKILEQGFYWYTSYTASKTTPEFSSSGAYVFRPLFPEALPVSMIRTINCTKTKTFQRASIVFNEWTSHEITIYRGSPGVEITWTVGPIPIEDNIGKEIIIRYNTDIDSKSKFYTDANGREVLERVRNHRPTWHYFVDEPISGNYYPINSRIWIQDENRQLTVLTDRSQGGGSIYDGSLEIMLHRRILHDDGLGVGEALNETAFGKGLVVTGRHVLFLEKPSESAKLHRTTAQQMFMHPLATYAIPNDIPYANFTNMYRTTWSTLSTTMPMNIHLLTFEQLDLKIYLVRVEHYFELNEDNLYSRPVTVDLQTIFNEIGTISEILELVLNANMPLSQMHRLEWTVKDHRTSEYNDIRNHVLAGTSVTLNPMEIRTFQITIN